MKHATLSDLRRRLRSVFAFIRAGESVLVTDGDRPIAEIRPVREPIAAGRRSKVRERRLRRLARAGRIELPKKPFDRKLLRPRGEGFGGALLRALLDDREEGR